MKKEKTWEEFRNSGMLWVVNRTLHIFGWSLIAVMEDEKIKSVYPARVKFRGFSEEADNRGFIRISEFLNKTSKELLEESKE